MNEDLKKGLIGLAFGLILLIFGYFSKYLKNNDKEEPKTKDEKIRKGLLNVTYVGYFTKGILGIIIIFISIIFFIKYLINVI